MGYAEATSKGTGLLTRRRVVILALVLSLVAAGGIAADTYQRRDADQRRAGTPSAPITAAAPVAPALALVPADGAADVDPLGTVAVTATAGALAEVTMLNDRGTRIDGIMTPDNTVWKPGVPLGYGATYTVTATATSGGATVQQTSTFTTLTPGNQTKVTLTTTSQAPLADGGTYGVGTVIVAHFDEPITDRAAAERRLTVTTSPPVAGSWNWVDDQNAHWRPPQYFAPGTVVTAAATVYGVRLGESLYGQEDTQVRFTIGDAHVSVADDTTKQVAVYNNGVLVRTMATSMGMGGTQNIGGRTLSFWTQPGTYTVMDKANPVIMDSSTYGLPINSRLGYRQTISYATRISTDGIYLHQLDSTVWAQGNTNVSHGCLNLNADNAKWFYDFSQPGDVVEVRNTGGQPLQLWQNGDWSVPWQTWRTGSALSQR